MFRVLVLAALAALAISAPASAAQRLSHGDRATLDRYAADTWRSFEAMVDPGTGLPSDNVDAAGARSEYTSPTNIATYMWSTLAARDLKIIKRRAATRRLRRTLTTLAGLERSVRPLLAMERFTAAPRGR